MSEDMKNQAAQEQAVDTAPVTEQAPLAAESVAPAIEPPVTESATRKKFSFADLHLAERLQKITDNKWVQLSNKISRAIMFLCLAITAYLGVIGFAFNVAFITLLVALATAFYVTLLAGANVILVRGQKRRVRKKAMRSLIWFGLFLVVALLLLLFSNIPYYDGRYGSPFHIQDYDAFYYDIVSEEGEKVAVIRDADRDAQTIMIPIDVNGYPVKYIEGKAFMDCHKLATFKVNSSHPYFKAEGGALYSKDMSTLICYPQQTLRLKNNLTLHVSQIGDYAFAGSALRTISLPVATKIGAHAFDSCSSLTNVDAPKLTTIGDYAFANCTQMRVFDIPTAVTYVGDSAFHGIPTTSTINVFANADAMADWSASWKNGCRAKISEN